LSNPLNGRSTVLNVVVDTGAEVTALDESVAALLGIDLTTAPTLSILGFGGRTRGRAAVVEILPLDDDKLRLRLEAVFVRDAGEAGNILGLDFLAFIDPTLSHSNNLISLQPA
jgi:predicted aspartyl protease